MTQKAKISGFSIPRLQSADKQEGKLSSKALDSRDAKELFDEITRKIHDHKYYSEWQPVGDVQFVNSRSLETAFREKKAAMKSEAPAGSKEAIQETVAFALVSLAEVKEISSKGLACGKGTTNTLGNRTMGVYLFRCLDVALRVAAFKLGPKAQVLVMAFKVALGKVKPVTLRAANDESFEPTPMFDCHVSQARPALNDKFVIVINKTYIYLYEFDDDCLPVQRPRQCLPFAVLNFVLKPTASLSVPAPPFAQAPSTNQNAPLAPPQLPPPQLPPPFAPPAPLGAKGSPQQPTSASPGSLSSPLSSPDRTLIDPRRLGTQSANPRRGILKGHAFPNQSSSSSPGFVQASHSSTSLASPMVDDGQFSPNNDSDAAPEMLRGPTIIPKYAPDHPKYKPWVEQMQKLGYYIEDPLARKHRSSRKRRSGSFRHHMESAVGGGGTSAGAGESSEEEGKERLQIKDMIMQQVNEMRAEAQSKEPEVVNAKLAQIKSYMPQLISRLTASLSSTELEESGDVVEDRFRLKLDEMMDKLKSDIIASNGVLLENKSDGGAAASDEGSDGDEVTVVQKPSLSPVANVITSVVKDVSVEEFRDLDKAIHKHYCLYYAEYSRLKEMRRMPEESSKEEMEAMENDIAKIQIEIEFLKHRVSQHKWPSELYLTPKDVLLKGEEKRNLRCPISEYQVCKVKEINKYIHKNYKRHAAASSSKDFKAVEKIQRELARFKKDRELTLHEVNMVPNMSSFSPGYDYDVVTRIRDGLIAHGPVNESQELFDKKLHFLDGKVTTLKLKKVKEINIVRQPAVVSTVEEVAMEKNGNAGSSGMDMTSEMADAVVKSKKVVPEVEEEQEDVLVVEEDEIEEEEAKVETSVKKDVTIQGDGVAWASPSVRVDNKIKPAVDEAPSFYSVNETSLPSRASELPQNVEPRSILKNARDSSTVTNTSHEAPTETIENESFLAEARPKTDPKHILKNANGVFQSTHDTSTTDATSTEEEVEIFDEAPASPDCMSDHDSGFEAPPELEREAASTASPAQADAPAAAVAAPESENISYFFSRLADSLSEVFTDMNAVPTTTTPLPSNARAAFTAKIASVISECGLENLAHLEAMSKLQAAVDPSLLRPNSQNSNNVPSQIGATDPDEPQTKKMKANEDMANGMSSQNYDRLPPLPPPPIPPPPVLPLTMSLSTTTTNMPIQLKPAVPPPPVVIPASSTPFFLPSATDANNASIYQDTDIRFLPQHFDRDDRNFNDDVDERLAPVISEQAHDKSSNASTISIHSSSGKDPSNKDCDSQAESIIILSAPASPSNSDDGQIENPMTNTAAEDVDSDRDVDLRVVESFNKNAALRRASADVDLRDTAVEIVDMELSSDEEGHIVEDDDDNSKNLHDTTICLDDDNDDNLQIVIDADDAQSEASAPSSSHAAPSFSAQVVDIASPSSPPVVTISDDNDSDVRVEGEEEGEILFDEDGGIIVGLDKGRIKERFDEVDVDSYKLYRDYEGLYSRLCMYIEKQKMKALSSLEETELEEVEMKLADIFFKLRELKLDFEPSVFMTEEEEGGKLLLNKLLMLPEEEGSEIVLALPLGKWQEEELSRLKREIADMKAKMIELVQLDEFPLNLTNVLVNLKIERNQILGRDQPRERFLVPPMKFKPTNSILRRLFKTYPQGDRKKTMIEDELLARTTVEESKISTMSYRDFLLLQDQARSVFKRLVSVEDGGKHSFQVDKMFYRHVQLANLKRKYASLCSMEEENGRKNVFDKEIPRGVPNQLSLKGDEKKNRPLSDWQLDALEAMKTHVEDLRASWSQLNKIQKLNEKGRKMLRALENFLHLRRFVISNVVLVPNLPSVLSSDAKEQPEMHLCSLLNDVLATDNGDNGSMDSLQMYECLMAIITEASGDASGDQENGGGWDRAFEKVSELLFWDDMLENKDLFFIKDSGRKHQSFYKPLVAPHGGPSVSSQCGSGEGERSSGDRILDRAESVRNGSDRSGLERDGERVSDRMGSSRNSLDRDVDRGGDRGRVSSDRTILGNGGRGGTNNFAAGKSSQPPRLLDLKIPKPVDKRLSSSDEEMADRRFISGNDRSRLSDGGNYLSSNNSMSVNSTPGRRSQTPPRLLNMVADVARRNERLSSDSDRGIESPRPLPNRDSRGSWTPGERVADIDLRSEQLAHGFHGSSPGDRGSLTPGRGILGSHPEAASREKIPPPISPHSSPEAIIRAGAAMAMNNIRMAFLGQQARMANATSVGGRGILGEVPRAVLGPRPPNPNAMMRDGFGMRLPANPNFRMPNINGSFRGIRRF